MKEPDHMEEDTGASQGTFAAWIRENDSELGIRTVQVVVLVGIVAASAMAAPIGSAVLPPVLAPMLLLGRVMYHLVRVIQHRRHLQFERRFLEDMEEDGAMTACLQPGHRFWSNSHAFQALRSLDVRPGLDRVVRPDAAADLRTALNITLASLLGRGATLNLVGIACWAIVLWIQPASPWLVISTAVVICGMAASEWAVYRLYRRQRATLDAVREHTTTTLLDILRNEIGRAAEAARPYSRTEPIRRKPWRRRS